MTAHSNREKEVMKYLQENYPEIRIWRFDNGQSYAKFSVKLALEEYKKTRSITSAMRKLVVITYGNEGFPDLAGIYMGIFVSIEIKVGKDKQREAQKWMQKTINKAGGIYMLIDDKSSLESQLKPLDGIKTWAANQK